MGNAVRMDKEPPPHDSHQRFGRLFKYLGEFVYGGIDGGVTTFAVVAGAVGAHLDTSIVLILGFANLIADGFSMSVELIWPLNLNWIIMRSTGAVNIGRLSTCVNQR